MKATWKLLPAGALIVLAGGCVPRTEYDAHVAKYDGLKTALATWSVQVRDWERYTKNVICDIVAKNTPDVGAYAQQTLDYCPSHGTEGAGVPPEPPDFGSF